MGQIVQEEKNNARRFLMASAVTLVISGLLMALLPGEVGAQVSDTETTIIKEPIRMIRDPFPAFSSVAVDTTRDEVVATDENGFQIMVFDREDNTPPNAAMTEPKRVISGPQTKIEFQCGLYVDQNTGDIYAVNNDTMDKLVIFSRESEGDVPPERLIETPHGTFGIAVDEENQELFLSVQHDSAIVTYRKHAKDDEPPLRMIQGDRTLLADPHGIAVDPARNLLFVANYGSTSSRDPSIEDPRTTKPNWPRGQRQAIPGSGKFLGPSITVYRRDASGDEPPLRVIKGARTQLNWPTGVAFHSEPNELYVTNDMTNAILIFDGNAEGNVAPKRILSGSNTRIDNPTGVYLDLKNQEMWVANFGNHSLGVFPIDAGGDVEPLRVIRSAPWDKPSLMIGNPGALAYDSKRSEILVPN